MKFFKSLLTVSLCSLALISCQETGSKAQTTPETKEVKTSTTTKEKTLAAKPETATFQIAGMTCEMGCAKTIEKKLAETNGIQDAKVDFDKKEATVTFDTEVLNTKQISDLVEACADGKTYKVSGIKTKA